MDDGFVFLEKKPILFFVKMKKNKNELQFEQKSLEDLEHSKSSDLKEYPTNLIKRCHEYRKIPLNRLTPEQLRTLIGQNIGLKYLIPITIQLLSKDILTEGDLYPGDLLERTTKIEDTFWTENLVLKKQLSELIDLNSEKIRNKNLQLKSL
jgi:hypothetical protein